MKESTIRMQARLFALIAELESEKTIVEAMKTENAYRESQGLAQAFSSESFGDSMRRMDEIAKQLHALSTSA